MRYRAESLMAHGGALNVMSVAVLRLLDALESAERKIKSFERCEICDGDGCRACMIKAL